MRWMDGWMDEKKGRWSEADKCGGGGGDDGGSGGGGGDGVKCWGRQVVRSSMLSHRFGALEGYKWDDERGEAAASKQVLRSGD